MTRTIEEMEKMRMTINDMAGEFDKYICPHCRGEGCDPCGFSGFDIGEEDEEEILVHP